MAFLKPGTLSGGAFGISFDVDKDPDVSRQVVYNRNERLGLSEQRRRLPIATHRLACLYAVETRAVTIIVGETGCGKSTQLPQYLLETGWGENGKIIACTQPRRVAAMTVAARVAEEVGTRLGETVGYSIRFEDVSSPGTTKVKFLTDGVVVREMMEDPLLSKYSVIMVDEAHERSVASDVLLGLLRKVLSRRPDLRLVIASATLEAEKLKEFFDMRTVKVGNEQQYKEPLIISISGRTHPVQVHYLEEPAPNYLKACVETVLEIHREGTPGDVLVFVTGQYDCERAVEMVNEEVHKRRRQDSGLKLMPVMLYSGLPARDQLKALQPPPRKFRKVVFATNIAETSVTIEGVVFVIDCCFAKARSYNPLTGLDALITAPISKASATQRAGRAGRVRPGHCFRLTTEADFDSKLREATVPEVQRSDLTSTVLQLKSLGVDNLMKFKWIDTPPAEAMIRALEHLSALGTLDNDARLSQPMGLKMSELPVEAPLAKALLVSGERGCSKEMATIASLLSVRSIWTPVTGQIRALERAKERFAVAEGDLITYLNVYRAWEEENRSPKWCQTNYVSHKALLRVSDIHNQLVAVMKRLGVRMASCDRDLDPLLKTIACGFCMSVARFRGTTVSHTEGQMNLYQLARITAQGAELKLQVHASSVLCRCQPEFLVFNSVEQHDSGVFSMRDVTTIQQSWLPELLPHLYEMRENH
ncbi:hypothetical protein BSKO_02327 [Bryopsis sp. KO-2023]|nr:hypothetical protein BSKO_02327 [Bryopsis sp. KO-2023]